MARNGKRPEAACNFLRGAEFLRPENISKGRLDSDRGGDRGEAAAGAGVGRRFESRGLVLLGLGLLAVGGLWCAVGLSIGAAVVMVGLVVTLVLSPV